MSTPEYSTEPRKPESIYMDSHLSSLALSAKIEQFFQWRKVLDRRYWQSVSTNLDYELREHVNEELRRMAFELTRRDHVANGGAA